jgi:myo-inositol-1(or 4)-monophosphatase
VNSPRPPSFAALLAFAHDLADAAGAAILPHFRKPLRVDDKGVDGAFDPVTAADRAAERAIAKRIAATYPTHGIIGEEFGARDAGARYRWVVDPIDGTRAFITGYPLWGSLIGLLDGDKPLLGIMDQPFTGERYWAAQRSSHVRTGQARARRLATRSCPKLSAAMLATTHPDLFAPGVEAEGFARIKAAVRMTRFGGDCYAYCQLAAGHLDLVVEAGLKAHDVVALLPIIERAGGVVTTWDGAPATDGGRIVAAGDPRLHEAALRLLSG